MRESLPWEGVVRAKSANATTNNVETCNFIVQKKFGERRNERN